MDQETLINGLAVIGALTLCYLVFRLLAAVAGWVQRDALESERASTLADKTKASPAAPAPVKGQPRDHELQDHDDAAQHDIAVIAAAVQAMMGPNTVVHITDPHSGQSWSAEGRWMHQTSHRTH